MKLIFKQRMFSWFDSYDIYYENGCIAFTVKGQLAWGHCLKIYDNQGRELGTVKERVLSFLPQFELYLGNQYMGKVIKEFTFLRPKFRIDCNGWTMEGNWLEWDYQILDGSRRPVAAISKQVLNWTDTYVLDIGDAHNALAVLMLVLAIDAEKCTRNNG